MLSFKDFRNKINSQNLPKLSLSLKYKLSFIVLVGILAGFSEARLISESSVVSSFINNPKETELFDLLPPIIWLFAADIFQVLCIWLSSDFAYKYAGSIVSYKFSEILDKKKYFTSDDINLLLSDISISAEAASTRVISPAIYLISSIITIIFICFELYKLEGFLGICVILILAILYILLFLFTSKLSKKFSQNILRSQRNFNILSRSFRKQRETVLNLDSSAINKNLFFQNDLRLRNAQIYSEFTTLSPKYIFEILALVTIIFMSSFLWGTDGFILFLTSLLISALRLMPAAQKMYAKINLIRTNFPTFFALLKSHHIAEKKLSFFNLNKYRTIEEVFENQSKSKDNKAEYLISINSKFLKKELNNSNELRTKYLKIPYCSKVQIVGKSGSGKSSFLRLLADKSAPLLIKKNIPNISEREISPNIFYMPQEPEFDIPIGLTFNNLLENSKKSEKLIKILELEEVSNRIKEWVKILSQYSSYSLPIFSGGELQRIFLFVAILSEKKNVLILDEPTSALHGPMKDEVANLLTNSKKTIIFSTHDRDFSKIRTHLIK